MADQNNQDEGIPADYLGDALKLLGGGGVITGTLITPNILKRMGKVSSMHPAVAAEQRWRGPLTDPTAVDEQRKLDDYVLNNYGRLNADSGFLRNQENIHRKYGWQVGPVTGMLRKEIPDLGIDVGRNSGYLTHPESNLLNALNVDNRVRFKNFASMYDPINDQEHYNAKAMWVNGDQSQPGQVWFSDTYIDPNFMTHYPYTKEELNRVVAHELQHAGHEDTGTIYNWNLPWEQRPHEHEAQISAFRSKYGPDAYRIPFNELSRINDPTSFSQMLDYKRDYPFTFDYYDVAPKLKKEGYSLDVSHGNDIRPNEYRIRKWGTSELVDPKTLQPELQELYTRLRKFNRGRY